MPLFKIIKPNSTTHIFIWKIEESLQQLEKNVFLTTKSKDRVVSMKSEIHQKEFLSVRYLLKEAGYSDEDVSYLENGKPYLKDGNHISMTHSFHFSAIIISDVEVGIDIEKCREKIEKVSGKFVGTEVDFLDKQKDYIDQLTAIWGAKESLYKLNSSKHLSFKNDISILPFKMEDKRAMAEIKKEKYHQFFQIYFEKIEDFVLVYSQLDSHPNPPEGRGKQNVKALPEGGAWGGIL